MISLLYVFVVLMYIFGMVSTSVYLSNTLGDGDDLLIFLGGVFWPVTIFVVLGAKFGKKVSDKQD